MKKVALFGLVQLIFGLVVAAQEPVAMQISWAGDWKRAERKARSEKRLMFIHFAAPSKEEFELGVPQDLRDPDVVRLSKSFVCVVVDATIHAVGNNAPCTHYQGMTCKAHSKDYGRILRKLHAGAEKVTGPQVVLFRPGKKEQIITFAAGSIDAMSLVEDMRLSLYREARKTLSPEDRKVAEEIAASRKPELDELFAKAMSNRPQVRSAALRVIAARTEPIALGFMRKKVRRQVGEAERLEAIKAMVKAVNPKTLPILMGLVRDRGQQMRRNAILALNKIGMVEAAPVLFKSFGRESSHRNQSLILRAGIRIDETNPAVRKILAKCFTHTSVLLRTHAVKSCLESDVNAKEFRKLITRVGDTSATVRRVAIQAATRFAVKNGVGGGGGGEIDGGYHQMYQGAAKIQKLTKEELIPLMTRIARRDESTRTRLYAEKCLEALRKGDTSRVDGGADLYDIDHLLFEEY